MSIAFLQRVGEWRNGFVGHLTAHKTFYSVFGTLLSCTAGWASYTSRQRHQSILEKRLQELNTKIDNKDKVTTPKKSLIVSVGTTILWTGIVFSFGYGIGRYHSRGKSVPALQKPLFKQPTLTNRFMSILGLNKHDESSSIVSSITPSSLTSSSPINSKKEHTSFWSYILTTSKPQQQQQSLSSEQQGHTTTVHIVSKRNNLNTSTPASNTPISKTSTTTVDKKIGGNPPSRA